MSSQSKIHVEIYSHNIKTNFFIIWFRYRLEATRTNNICTNWNGFLDLYQFCAHGSISCSTWSVLRSSVFTSLCLSRCWILYWPCWPYSVSSFSALRSRFIAYWRCRWLWLFMMTEIQRLTMLAQESWEPWSWWLVSWIIGIRSRRSSRKIRKSICRTNKCRILSLYCLLLSWLLLSWIYWWVNVYFAS